jgi:integration host factor subunit beta
VTIPEKLVPHFKPGKALREAVDARLPLDDDPPTRPD